VIRAPLLLILLGYLPGALLFRVPLLNRARRAQLPADERVFWHVMLSAVLSLAVVLSLGLASEYSFGRLIAVMSGISAILIAVFRARLRYHGQAARPGWPVVLPIALVALGVWRFFPSAEYVIGGRDPGTYISEGIQIAQRGSLAIHDPVVAAVPDDLKSLFFAGSDDPNSESSRFKGFYVLSLRTAKIMGQFPHLFPASIAIGYGLGGLTGARLATGVWAIAGLLAVYFVGARLLGRPAAFAGAALLGLHVIQVWFARYPNSEIAMQALLFAAILALARAQQDDDPFFAPVAGALLAGLFFLRLDALLVLACVVMASGLAWLLDGKRPRASFVLTLAVGTVAGLVYLTGPLRAYVGTPIYYFTHQPIGLVVAVLGGGAALVATLISLRRWFAAGARTAVPIVLTAIAILAAGYAYFLRQPDPITAIKVRLADHDAFAFRTFVDFYLFWPALAAALAGLALVARRHFWRDPAFAIVFVSFSLVFFYKIRVFTDHFWMARRFATMILPGALLLAAAAAVGIAAGQWRGWRLARAVAGSVFLGWLGWQYAAAAAPVVRHVEYGGIIPYIERLAGQFTDRDLLIVEGPRVTGDVHVFSVPLAYIYARNVLVLASEVPDKALLERFLRDATTKYARVFFIGGGGTDLLSRRIVAVPVSDGRTQVAEYAHTPWNVYPDGPRRKDFEYGIYEISLGASAADPFVLDVGASDDLHVLRFFAKEPTEGRTIRWTGARSNIAIPGLTGRERELRLVIHDGGRPAAASPAVVTVFFNDVPIQRIAVTTGFRTYVAALPPELVRLAAASDEPARITLESTTWRPRDHLPVADDRQLGVMLDRVEVH
jgi:hypothetical protein